MLENKDLRRRRFSGGRNVPENVPASLGHGARVNVAAGSHHYGGREESGRTDWLVHPTGRARRCVAQEKQTAARARGGLQICRSSFRALVE